MSTAANRREDSFQPPVGVGPDFDLEKRTLELGREIFANSQKFFKKPFRKGYLTDKMMEYSMEHPDFKVEMFRFVDVLPTLVNNDQINRHLKEYFLKSQAEIPFWVRSGLSVATNLPLAESITAGVVKSNVTSMAKSFITGENANSANENLEKIWDRGICFTVDILGEAAVAENEAFDYQRRYLDLVEGLSKLTQNWQANPLLEETPHGSIPRANVSVKLTSLYSQIDPLAYRHSAEKIKEKLRPILQAAVRNNAFVNIDMEQNDFRELFITVAEEIFFEEEFRNYPHFGIVVQAYLKDSLKDLKRWVEYCKQRGAPVTIRLVKGAYWDFEVIQSKQNGWDIPVYTKKAESDLNYEACTHVLLENYPHILAAFGSHNVRSLSYAMARAEELGLPKSAIEVQMLYGMADAFKESVIKLGYRVREYAPVGEMIPGMAYLVRRLLENSSNEGFLKVKYMKPEEATRFLATPKIQPSEKGQNMEAALKKEDVLAERYQEKFENQALLDFSKKENRDWIPEALNGLREKFPLTVHPVLDGQEVEGTPVNEVPNPCDTHEIITRVSFGNQYHADLALKACEKAKKTWMLWEPKRRAEIIQKAADLMEERRHELTSLVVLESSKNFHEADGDVCEAIDFCRYYALQMLDLVDPKLTQDLPGEDNRYSYKPRGTAVAIAPWNFPLAILCGMTVGPLVCGNPVIMKPAEQSSGIASYLYRVLIEAGVPQEALQLLPGAGEIVGEYLVNHSNVHIITFTGSKAVGLNILRAAYNPLPGQKHIKKVVAELGGKNGLIIDEDADLDEAVQGAIYSAFGFQGQKCSALSRIFVMDSCYEKFKTRFTEAMMSLVVGPAEDLATRVAAVIDSESRDRLMSTIREYQNQIVAQLKLPQPLESQGYFVPPTVFESDDYKSDLGQKEFFGPLVTLFRVKSLDEAIEAMNSVDYALTGGFYSRSPANIERLKRELEVGNLYVNRGITGALVCRQPFGGYKLSGVGGKAGGPDYLLQFLEPITVTENTMRRGFAPDL